MSTLSSSPPLDTILSTPACLTSPSIRRCAGSPVHSSLCNLASQIRLLIVALLHPSRPATARLLSLNAAIAAFSATASSKANAHSDDEDSTFAVWLGCELGARGGAQGASRLSHLLKRAVTCCHEPNAQIRTAALELLTAGLRCEVHLRERHRVHIELSRFTAVCRLRTQGATTLSPMALACILHAALLQSHHSGLGRGQAHARSAAAAAEPASSVAKAALELLIRAAPAVLRALNPHAPVEFGWEPSSHMEAITQASCVAAVESAVTYNLEPSK